jgi:uncharacterized repeat protein (TIGR04076 family)
MIFPKLKVTVTKKEGPDVCYHGYKIGDEFIFEDFTHPPKHFCQGAMHSLFPCMYALSFGSRFNFMDNPASLLTTCPDGGKMEMKIELLDKDGKVMVEKKDPNYKGPSPKKLIVEVVKVKGNCTYKYNLGDKFEFEGLKCKEGFCGAAYHTMFPALFALNFGAKFFFMKEPNSIDTVTCPDGGKIVFKVTREERLAR